MVVQEAVRNRDIIRSMGDIQKPIVKVLPARQVRGQITMVHPDLCGFVDTDRVPITRFNFRDLQVAQNDIVDFVDVQTDARE